MRYRQQNQQHRSSDQKAKELINNNDVLSTKEQEEVIAYFARSLRTSTIFLKIVVCLHVLVALVYLSLLLSGSLPFDLEVSQESTAHLLQVVRQRQPETTTPATAATDPAFTAVPLVDEESTSTTTTTTTTSTTQDPLVVLAALDEQQRAANRRYTNEYLQRRGGGPPIVMKPVKLVNLLAVLVTLLSIAMLLSAAWSGFTACRQLRVNVDDLTSTEPRELGTLHTSAAAAADTAAVVGPSGSSDSSAAAQRPKKPVTYKMRVKRFKRRMRADPPLAQYFVGCLASLASLFWLGALLHRQRAMQRAYMEAGLEAPSVFTVHKITDAFLEYVLAVWQPLLHFGIGRLLRSMLNTKDNLIALSKMKYRFEKV